MGKTSGKPSLSFEEKDKIKLFNQELIRSGITNRKEQAQYIQQELIQERIKKKEEKRTASSIHRVISRIKEIFRPITEKLVKKILMQNQPEMDAQFKQMFENIGENPDDLQGFSNIYDQFKDQTIENLQKDSTFVDDRPKPKKKPVFFDDEG